MDDGAPGELHRIHELAQVPVLRRRFVGWLTGHGVDGDLVAGWELTITELLNNAIEHGCVRPGDEVSVRWRLGVADVEVTVTDPGPCCLSKEDFDHASCDDFGETGRGAGLFLIRGFADELSVRPGARGGTEIEVHKRLASPQNGTGS